MGCPKLALPLGAHTVLERAVGVFRQAGVERVLVVLAPHVAQLAPLAERAGGTVLQLAAATPDMRTTVQHGLAWLQEHEQPAEEAAWLLMPADHPTLAPQIVAELCAAREQQPQYSIFLPVFEGKRGHPVMLTWAHALGLQRWPPEQGINAYIRAHAAQTWEVQTSCADVLVDLDTPADYERLQRSAHLTAQ